MRSRLKRKSPSVVRTGKITGERSGLARGVILSLAAARLTRLITTDWAGEWLVVMPIKEWAYTEREALWRSNESPMMRLLEATRVNELTLHEVIAELQANDLPAWRSKLVSGLDCSFCVGFWLGLGVIVVEAKQPRGWGVVRDALALNYISAHLSSRLD